MSTSTAQLYDVDFYSWIQQQANVLKAGNFTRLDVDNLIDEIESMGKSEKRELESRLEVLLAHLLKWQFQPDFRGKSWQLTIKEQRRRIADHLDESPSLKKLIPKRYEKIYSYAVTKAAKETGMEEFTFPVECPWTFEQAMDASFWPESDCSI